jgi:pimeloyl-ACP methyl ester carboxylesterase
MTSERHTVDNGVGFRLSLRHTAPDGEARERAREARGGRPPRPLVIVPGYGMNSFIFSYHPHGPSLEASLAARGIDVWSVDLRGQGDSIAHDAEDPERYGLADLAGTDVGAALGYVLGATARSTSPWDGNGDGKVDVLGASLGASLVLGHIAMNPGARVGSVVTLGGLVTWVTVPAMLRALFRSPWLMGHLPLRGTRKLAGFALPTLAKVAPGFLSIYMHTRSTDIEQASTMVRTVEDPNRHVNREIAEWVARKELVLGGVNVSRALPSMHNPLLCIVAMQDGIVPPDTATALFEAMGSFRKVLLEVGTPDAPIAHADLFLSTGVQEKVFEKIADFLLDGS